LQETLFLRWLVRPCVEFRCCGHVS